MPIKHLFVLINIRNKDEVGTIKVSNGAKIKTSLSPHVRIFFTERSKAVFRL